MLVYPLALGVYRSVVDRDGGTNAYAWFLDNTVYARILLRTFITAGWVTLICLALGFPYAYLMTVAGRRTRSVLMLVVLLPFWTSALVRIFAWVVLLQPGGIVSTALSPIGVGERLLGTQAAVLMGMSQLLLPFMVIPIYTAMRTIDPQLMLAAESLGARPTVAFWRVFAPLSAPGVWAGSALVFILSLGFYVVPALLGSPSQSLIAQTIYQQVSGLLYFGRGGALAVFLLAATILVFGSVALVRRLVSRLRGDRYGT
ncbi:ABC transporter permease [Nocardioides sp.]|uniref:ABC transporter permease n=1 Tax=Nocardioides sp. TaxID=35761 RepID=UPI003784F179